jgi:glutathione S-transferase
MNYYTNPRCKICTSSLRDEIDRLLLGEGEGRLTYAEIVDWCAAKGLQTSTGALSRHRNNHLQPALAAALETQAVVDAITAATGKKLSIQSAVVNIVTTHILRRLNSLEDNELGGVKLEALLKLVPRLAEVAGKLEKTETALSETQVQAVGAKLETAGLDKATLERIKKELYGL